MRIAINLGPTTDWSAALKAAQRADEYGCDAVGFLDHYQAIGPQGGYICGWSLYGALAMATSRIHLLPQVICNLNYLPGVLAKEAAMLDLISGGRF